MEAHDKAHTQTATRACSDLLTNTEKLQLSDAKGAWVETADVVSYRMPGPVYSMEWLGSQQTATALQWLSGAPQRVLHPEQPRTETRPWRHLVLLWAASTPPQLLQCFLVRHLLLWQTRCVALLHSRHHIVRSSFCVQISGMRQTCVDAGTCPNVTQEIKFCANTST